MKKRPFLFGIFLIFQVVALFAGENQVLKPQVAEDDSAASAKTVVASEKENPLEPDYDFNLEPQELSPISKKDLSENKNTATLVIDCNQKSAEVYINSIYQGKTKLTINKLLPADYILEVRKKGFATKKYYVTAKAGYAFTYRVVLE